MEGEVLRDDQWEILREFVPGGRKGRRGPRSDARWFFGAILWLARSGGRWRDLPERFGPYQTAKRRYSPPPEAEADQWILGFEDVDDEYGNTIKRGIPEWTPKAESDEWHRLRFGVNRDDEGTP